MRMWLGLTWFLLSGLSSSGFGMEREAHLIRDNAQAVHSLLVAVREGKQPPQVLTKNLQIKTSYAKTLFSRSPVLDKVQPRPILMGGDILLAVTGDFQVVLQDGQRSCQAIQDDWTLLDGVYTKVNKLAVDLGKLYSQDNVCGPCVDKILQALSVSTRELEEISNRLGQDGNRLVVKTWSGQRFREAMQQWNSGHLTQSEVFSLEWQDLVYANIDGASQLAESDVLLIPNPLQKGVFYQLETSAERACSQTLEIRLDGVGTAHVFPRDQPVKRMARGGRIEIIPWLLREELLPLNVSLL